MRCLALCSSYHETMQKSLFRESVFRKDMKKTFLPWKKNVCFVKECSGKKKFVLWNVLQCVALLLLVVWSWKKEIRKRKQKKTEKKMKKRKKKKTSPRTRCRAMRWSAATRCAAFKCSLPVLFSSFLHVTFTFLKTIFLVFVTTRSSCVKTGKEHWNAAFW